MTIAVEPARNLLLRGLPPRGRDELARRLQRVSLRVRDVIQLPGEPIRRVYFFDTAIASIVAEAARQEADTGLVGYEGMSGISALLGNVIAPYACTVRIAGDAYWINATELTHVLEEDPESARHLIGYAEFLTIQVAFTVLSNARFTVLERMARWILMCHDRIEGDEIELTHAALSAMLGVRRAGITTDMHVLEGEGALLNRRGRVLIRDRRRLERFAGDAYGPPEAAYQRLLGASLRRPRRSPPDERGTP